MEQENAQIELGQYFVNCVDISRYGLLMLISFGEGRGWAGGVGMQLGKPQA